MNRLGHVDLNGTLIGRLHQTRLSHLVKTTAVTSELASRWWDRQQAVRFAAAIDRLAAPLSAEESAINGPAQVPSRQEVMEKMPPLILAGETFSDEMGRWCRTSKFASVTQDPGSCGYQDIYARLLDHMRQGRPRILEIGIGINDPSARSGMETAHSPGASLVGWSEYFPESEVHGADVDERCLVNTDRYTTHKVDQRDPDSLARLAALLGPPVDLLVDDGLHTPEANGNTIAALLPLISPAGVMVIEDIQPRFDALWEEFVEGLRTEYAGVYYPSRILRQYRDPGSAGGMAVITRR